MKETHDAKPRPDVGEVLRAGDPHQGQALDVAERQRILTHLRAAARVTPAASAFGPLAWAAMATAVLAVAIAWLAWPGGPPVVPENVQAPALPAPPPTVVTAEESPAEATTPPAIVETTPEALHPALLAEAVETAPTEPVAVEIAASPSPRLDRQPRSVQFTAPRGTRIIWTLDPEFDLGGAQR